MTELTDFHDPHPKLFDAAVVTLRHLGEPGLRDRRLLRFELACLRELGLMPALDACAHCGAAGRMPRATRVAFGLATGGVLCPACRPGQPHVATLSGRTLEALRVLAAPGPAWRSLDPGVAALAPSGRPSARSSATTWAAAPVFCPISVESDPMPLANRITTPSGDPRRALRRRRRAEPSRAASSCAALAAWLPAAGCQSTGTNPLSLWRMGLDSSLSEGPTDRRDRRRPQLHGALAQPQEAPGRRPTPPPSSSAPTAGSR